MSVPQHRITADGSSGFKAEAGRYHLYAGLFCPFAARAFTARSLKGLQNVVSITWVDPVKGEDGWRWGSKIVLFQSLILSSFKILIWNCLIYIPYETFSLVFWKSWYLYYNTLLLSVCLFRFSRKLLIRFGLIFSIGLRNHKSKTSEQDWVCRVHN